MQTAPAGFDAAIAQRRALTVQAPIARAGVDLASAVGWAEEIEVRRELSGELPPAASTVVGGVSATMTARGDAFADGAPSPLRPGDVRRWLNSDTSVRVGYDGLTVPAFAGRVVDLDATEEAGRLALTARDASARLTEPVTLPAYGSTVQPYALGALTRNPTNTQAVIVQVLHANGIRVSPAPREGCVLSVPGVGGWLADVGWTLPTGGSAPAEWLAGGLFGSVPNVPQQRVRGWFSERVAYGVAYLMAEAFVLIGGNRSGVLDFALAGAGRVSVDVSAGSLQVRAYSGPSSTLLASGPIDTGWRHVCVEIRGSNYLRVFVDGVPWGSSSTPWAVSVGTGYVESLSWIGSNTQAVAVYSSGTPNLAPTPALLGFAPEADVARGALDLVSVPAVTGRDSWEVLQEIASAELGMVGFDESGRFFFRTRADLAANTDPVADWGLDLVDDVHVQVSTDSVLTRATATARRVPGIDSGLGASTEETTAIPAFVADDVLTIPPGTSSVVLTGAHPFVPIRQHVAAIATPGAAWDNTAGMALCRDRSGITRYTGTDVSAWIAPVSATSVRVSFMNGGSETIYAVWPQAWTKDGSAQLQTVPFGFDGGGPALWLLGFRFTDEAAIDESVDRQSASGVATWGTKLQDFGDSPWWQDAAVLAGFLDGFLADTSSPRATVSDVTVPGDPRLQLGDPVRVQDASGRVPGFVARVTSITARISRNVENGLSTTYGLRQIVGTIPEVVTHPTDRAGDIGDTVTFSAFIVNATTRQWQVDDGRGWRNIAGATSSSYSPPALTAAMTGQRFRCVATNAAGSDTTRAGALIVRTDVPASAAPVITQQPAAGLLVNASQRSGTTVTVTSAASSDGTLSVQWQLKALNLDTGVAGPWTDIYGATSPTLTRVISRANGFVFSPEYQYRFRAVWSNSAGTIGSDASGPVNTYTE